MDNENEIDIAKIVKSFWKKKEILLIILIISLILGMIYTFAINKPIYQSSTKILIDKNAPSIAEYIHSNDIITEVASNLNISNESVEEAITTSFDTKTLIITINASSTNNETAYSIVINYSEVLKNKLDTTYGVKTYTQIEQAQVSNTAYNVNHIKDLLMFLVTGAVICGLYGIFFTIHSGDNIYSEIKNSKIIFLGKIDKDEKTNTNIKSYISKNENTINCVKKIMANIELSKIVLRPKTILVTGTSAGVGTTYFISNLATRYAKTNKKVLIIDSNLKKGIQDKIFNIKNEIGLTDLIASNQINTENISKLVKQSPTNNIYVLPSGKEIIDEEFLISKKVNEIIEIVKKQFDIVIIDGEPIQKQITAYGWVNSADATVIVAEYEKTKINEIVDTKKIAEEIDGKVLGVIVNKVK